MQGNDANLTFGYPRCLDPVLAPDLALLIVSLELPK